MLPTQWIVIATDILTVGLAVLGFIDHTWHTALLINPITLSVLAILGGLGIHQTVSNSNPPKV